MRVRTSSPKPPSPEPLPMMPHAVPKEPPVPGSTEAAKAELKKQGLGSRLKDEVKDIWNFGYTAQTNT